MKTFHATSLSLQHYVTDTYVYPPKNIVVDAIQITAESIGGLCLEYEADMMWDHEVGAHFVIWAHRNEGAPVSLLLRPGFWLVPLRGEIHRFDDYTFENTFVPRDEQLSPYDHEALVKYAKQDLAATMKIVRHNSGFDQLIAKSSVGKNAQPPTPEEMEQIARQFGLEAFHQNDRILVKGTNRLGTVSVVGVEEDGVAKIEAVMDADGLHYLFEPGQLQILSGRKDDLEALRKKLAKDDDEFNVDDKVFVDDVFDDILTVTIPETEGGVEVVDKNGRTAWFAKDRLTHYYSTKEVDWENEVKD